MMFIIAVTLLPLNAYANGGTGYETYTLTLDPNYDGGHVRIIHNVSLYSFNGNEFTRQDHTILGWALSPDDEFYYLNNDTIRLEEDTTLYAIWDDFGSNIELPAASILIDGIQPYDGGKIYFGGKSWDIIGQSEDKWLLISSELLGRYEISIWEDAKIYCTGVFKIFSTNEKN